MSGSVDVLAVIDDRIESLESTVSCARDEGNHHIADQLESAQGELGQFRVSRSILADLMEAADSYMNAEAALANRELDGINAEPLDKLQRQVYWARTDLEESISRARGESP